MFKTTYTVPGGRWLGLTSVNKTTWLDYKAANHFAATEGYTLVNVSGGDRRTFWFQRHQRSQGTKPVKELRLCGH